MNNTYINKTKRATGSVCLSSSCGHYYLDLTLASAMVLPFRGHVDSEDSEKPGVGGNPDLWWHFDSLNSPAHKPSYPGLAIMSENITLGLFKPVWVLISVVYSYQQPSPLISQMLLSSPDGSDDKESACNTGYMGLIPGSRWLREWREWQPTPVFLPGEVTVHGVGNSQTRLSDQNFHFHYSPQ